MAQRTQSYNHQQYKQVIAKQNYSLSVRRLSKSIQFQLLVKKSETKTQVYRAVISSLKDIGGLEKQFTDFDKFKQYVLNEKHVGVDLQKCSVKIIDVVERNNRVVEIGEIMLKDSNQQIQWMKYIDRKCEKDKELSSSDAKQIFKMLSHTMLTILSDIKNIKQKQLNQQERLWYIEQEIINYKANKSIRQESTNSNIKQNFPGINGWVDPQCFSFKNIVQNFNTITALAPAQIFGKVKLLGQSTFTAKFTRIGTYPVCIGLVDIQNKSMAALIGVRNLVYYQSNSGAFDGNVFKVGQGHGFRIGQPISVVVDFSLGKIQWYVGFSLRHQEKVSILSNSKIRWVPFICLPNKDDSVTIINE